MSVISYPNSQSTLTLNGHVFQNLMEGEALSLNSPNEATARTNSMNGGVSVSNRIDKGVSDLTVMVQRHSKDDKTLNDAKNSSSPVIFEGSMKRAYFEDGTSKKTTTTLASGSITTQPTTADNNQDADNSRTYVIQFRNAVETF
jgi:hypothetical protein